MTRLLLAAALLIALPARANPCVQRLDGWTCCSAARSQAVEDEIIDLRRQVAVAVAREQEQRELRAADTKRAEAELVAARARIAALEQPVPPPSVLPWVAGGAVAGVLAVVAVVLLVR